MENLPKDKILKYHPDTLKAVRRLYNLDKPGQMKEAVDNLEDWLEKQNHFVKKDFSREYLERVIILLKGSVERAKAQIDKMCTLRTLLPHFFEAFDAKNDFKEINGKVHIALLPKLTEDHTRVYFTRISPDRWDSKIFFQIYCYNIMVCEYLKAHEYNDGLLAIIDLRDVSITDVVTQLNLTQLKQVATIYLEGYDTRCKKLLFISKSNAIDVILKIFKQMISEKLGKRIHVIKEIEELNKHVSIELLPSDYGGNEKPLAALHEELLEALSSKENIVYLQEMSKARTNESMRLKRIYDEEFLGIAGTFRTLSVD